MLQTGPGGYPAQRSGESNVPLPYDEFDLDIRLGAAGAKKPHDICEGTEDGTTCAAECGDLTDDCETDACATDRCGTQECNGPTDNCTEATCATCKATCNTHCNQQTCHTCQTKCNQHTCVNTQCQQHTCVNTQCQQHTCVNTQCQQHTCATCQTECKQHGCPTALAGETCVACTHVTCGNQPACRL